MESKRVNIKVSEKCHGWYSERAEEIGTSMSSMMAIALTEYMEQKETINNVPNVIDMVSKIEELKKFIVEYSEENDENVLIVEN